MADDPEDSVIGEDDAALGSAPLSIAELDALATGKVPAGPDEIQRLVEEVRDLRHLLCTTFEYAEALDEARTHVLGTKKPSESLMLADIRRALWTRGFLGGPNPDRGS